MEHDMHNTGEMDSECMKICKQHLDNSHEKISKGKIAEKMKMASEMMEDGNEMKGRM